MLNKLAKAQASAEYFADIADQLVENLDNEFTPTSETLLCLRQCFDSLADTTRNVLNAAFGDDNFGDNDAADLIEIAQRIDRYRKIIIQVETEDGALIY